MKLSYFTFILLTVNFHRRSNYNINHVLKLFLCSFVLCVLSFLVCDCDGQYLRGNITSQENTVLAKFREITRDLLKNQPEHISSDWTLVKWLRARDLDIARSKEMLEQALKWRAEYKIDRIIYENFSFLEKRFPYLLDSIDKYNRPVVILQMGLWDPRREVIAGHRMRILRYMDKILETATWKAFHLSNSTMTVPSFVLIVDAHGFSPRIHMCLSCIPIYFDIIRHFDAYFPEATNDIFVINTPRTFQSFINIVEPFIDQLSTAKAKGVNVRVYSHNKAEWAMELLKIIPADQLPVQYGGTKGKH